MASVPPICRQCRELLRASRSARLRRGTQPFTRAGRLMSTSRDDKIPASSTKDTEKTHAPIPNREEAKPTRDGESDDATPEPGPMARRLQEATEDALLTGGRAGRRAVEDAGFSEELKSRLLDKLADARFRTDSAASFAAAAMDATVPSAAGRGTRDLAAAQAWTGEERAEDAVLRMLNDKHKPLARELRGGGGRPRAPVLKPVVDMRLRQEPRASPGMRAASARDRAAVYAGMGLKEKGEGEGEGGGVGLSAEAREALRKELRERFAPGARAMPNTISGLAAMANERIEDAIARGQFKNIPRGKGVERDARADNPFIDTTEYIMNKMIKRQDMVPPWIEKQQDLLKAVNTFRSRLRNDWKRHAARMMASRGWSLQEQMSRAAEYARAEEIHNPRRRNADQISVSTNLTDDVVMAARRQEPQPQPPQSERSDAAAPTGGGEPEVTLSGPFRDPTWLATEKSYMELAIANMNTLTRSYNLMAPELAKKPYFSLERELNNCYADVAPQLPEIIKERATRPTRPRGDSAGPGPLGVLERFGGEGSAAKIYDSKSPNYGLKEMWRDLFSRPS